jgi:hypothetical protein
VLAILLGTEAGASRRVDFDLACNSQGSGSAGQFMVPEGAAGGAIGGRGGVAGAGTEASCFLISSIRARAKSA